MKLAHELRRLFEPAAEVPRRWYWTPIVVLIFGLISIVVLVWILWITDQRTAQNLAMTRAVQDLQSAVAYWHLWLEEHLTGDLFVDLERDVRGNQDLSLRLASHLLRGGQWDNGDLIHPLSDPALRQEAEELEAALIAFRNLSEKRLLESAGVGTPLDQDFDHQFHQVREHIETLRRLDDEYLQRDRVHFRLQVGLTVGVWTLIVAAASAALWSRERRRQQAADTLRSSQRWLATTLSSIDDAVVTTDLEGNIFFMNPVAEQLTGWARDKASGRSIDEVFVIQDEKGQPIENPVTGVLRTGESVSMTHHTVLIDRLKMHTHGIDESAAPIRDDRHQLLGVVLVFRDVGQRRRTEIALRQREAELQQAQKMEAVGRLAGGIAHDVNNYLGAMRGYCEVAVLKGESGAALEKRMQAAIDTADKVSTLIQQLLAFSRRQPVQPEVVDLNRVVRDLESLMKQLLGENINLTTHLSGDLWSVEIDLSQIEQTLVNLLVNARDAMPTGGDIVIETHNLDLETETLEGYPAAANGRYVLLSVDDTGSGIPRAVQKQIFDPFFTTKEESGSSGLGLATVFAIVQQYGGFVAVHSDEGQGARFDILLPTCDAPVTVRSSKSNEPVESTHAVHILLVEDNDDMREASRTMLETLGHQVAVAAAAEEAWSHFDHSEVPFDLLITDVILPGMSGKELHDRVRQSHGELPCLFISGYTDNIMLRHGLRQDRVHFLKKPFSYEDLGRKIAEILGETPPP